MRISEIPLKFTTIGRNVKSENFRCEFCDRLVYFYHCTAWISKEDTIVNEVLGDKFHHCPAQPRSWCQDCKIPEGWEYDRSDHDDDSACFIRKKYTRFS